MLAVEEARRFLLMALQAGDGALVMLEMFLVFVGDLAGHSPADQRGCGQQQDCQCHTDGGSVHVHPPV